MSERYWWKNQNETVKNMDVCDYRLKSAPQRVPTFYQFKTKN